MSDLWVLAMMMGELILLLENAVSESHLPAFIRKPGKVLLGLKKDDARTDLLNRLRRAEGQLRGIQRMIEEGGDCQSIGQQFSAVRKALDSTYRRMTICFFEQEMESLLANASPQGEAKAIVLKDLEAMLERMR